MTDSIKREKKVGAYAYDLLSKPDTKQGVVDTQREMDKTYLNELQACVERYKDWNFPFYVVVVTKKERLMQNVMRRYFFARQTMPTPTYDQTLWKYNPKTGDMEFIWVIPDKHTCATLPFMADELTEEFKWLVDTVKKFNDGTLDRMAAESEMKQHEKSVYIAV